MYILLLFCRTADLSMNAVCMDTSVALWACCPMETYSWDSGSKPDPRPITFAYTGIFIHMYKHVYTELYMYAYISTQIHTL